jgi:hypothetical protein
MYTFRYYSDKQQVQIGKDGCAIVLNNVGPVSARFIAGLVSDCNEVEQTEEINKAEKEIIYSNGFYPAYLE